MKRLLPLVIGIAICGLVTTPALAQFQQGSMGVGVSAGYTLPVMEMGNWFDATYQVGGKYTYALSGSKMLEIQGTYGKFDKDRSRHNRVYRVYNETTGEYTRYTIGQTAEFPAEADPTYLQTNNWDHSHEYQYVKAAVNFLMVPSFGQMQSTNLYYLFGISMTRWEYERPEIAYEGWDNQSRDQITQTLKYINRNGYDFGVNLGLGGLIDMGGAALDIRAQYEACVGGQWPSLLVGLEKIELAQFIGVQVGLRMNIM